MIIANNVVKNYDHKPVLNDVSITINDCGFLAITGASGSGKTTLLHIMGYLIMPDKGIISIDGKEILSKKEKLMFHRYQAGFLFQNFALIEDKTAIDNLRIALTYRVVGSKEQAIIDVAEKLNLTDLLRKKVYQLSGGEQQRVALARLILKDPKYIFADEPTGNLDVDNRDIVFNHLISLNKLGKTVVLVTHDKELVAQVNDVIAL